MQNVIDLSKQNKSGKIVHGSRVMNRKEYGTANGLRGAALKRAHKAYLVTAYGDRKATLASDANLAIERVRETDKRIAITYVKLNAIKVTQPRATLAAENETLKKQLADAMAALSALNLGNLKVA